MVQNFNIDLTFFKNKGFFVTFPFNIVTQTNNLEIEKHCKETWPKLLDRTFVHTPQDNLDQNRMEKYIANTFNKSSNDVKTIHSLFYEKGWMGQISLLKGFSTIKFIDFDAKTWTNPDVPYLEIKGEFTVDLEKILNYYLQSKGILIDRTNKFVREELILKFMVGLPQILTYISSPKINDLIVNFFEVNFKKQKSLFNTKLVSLTKIENLHTYKNKIFWYGPKEIRVEVNDMLKILGAKATRPLPLTAAGFLAYNYLQRQKKIGKILNKLGNLYE